MVAEIPLKDPSINVFLVRFLITKYGEEKEIGGPQYAYGMETAKLLCGRVLFPHQAFRQTVALAFAILTLRDMTTVAISCPITLCHILAWVRLNLGVKMCTCD